MSEAMPAPRASSLDGPGTFRRKPVTVSTTDLIRTGFDPERPRAPLIVRPKVPDVDLATWARADRPRVQTLLAEHRALLFRGFPIPSTEAFSAVVAAVSDGTLLDYRDRSSPRHEVGDRIYTSTDYPRDQTINLHNEGTYWQRWPLKIVFACLQRAETGGETPIADCRRVYERIAPAVRDRFRERRIRYVRNYNDGFGLTWQTVFQTEDPAEVEAYCGRNDIAVEWKPGGRLRTRAIRDAIAHHPVTGEAIWFNHGAFFHVSSLDSPMREELLASFAEADLPSNTYYGDGTPIEPEVLDEIRAAYRAEKTVFPWQQQDVLLLDNMSFAHGREPYTGERTVMVGMAEPYARPGTRHAGA